jgi:hypothetical protein
MENYSSISSPDSKGKPGEDKVRWGCAGLVLDSGTDAEQDTNFLLQKKYYLPLLFIYDLDEFPVMRKR